MPSVIIPVAVGLLCAYESRLLRCPSWGEAQPNPSNPLHLGDAIPNNYSSDSAGGNYCWSYSSSRTTTSTQTRGRSTSGTSSRDIGTVLQSDPNFEVSRRTVVSAAGEHPGPSTFAEQATKWATAAVGAALSKIHKTDWTGQAPIIQELLDLYYALPGAEQSGRDAAGATLSVNEGNQKYMGEGAVMNVARQPNYTTLREDNNYTQPQEQTMTTTCVHSVGFSYNLNASGAWPGPATSETASCSPELESGSLHRNRPLGITHLVTFGARLS